MADPSPEVVTAALALAEAADRYCGSASIDGLPESSRPFFRSVAAYRAAIAPKRSRAEVALDLAEAICFSERRTVGKDVSLVAVDTGKVSDLITEYGRAKSREQTAPEPNHTRVIPGDDPDPCSCDEALALKERITQALAHLSHRECCTNNAYVQKAVEILRR